MAEYFINSKAHEQSYLLGEMESLGLRMIQLNEFNDNSEPLNLVNGIRDFFLKEYGLLKE
ncbi:MAG: hypothetical protein ACREAY_04425 [Nitrososphaera sp.]|uniref:hypothetical protein n=1 Tax=Nitrososphaera sp. TaxID=1971748 RepID=UPI003D6EE540